jgi:hypothetical protein
VPEPGHEAAVAEEVEEGGGRRGRRSLTVLWVLMALAASIYRSCAAPG